MWLTQGWRSLPLYLLGWAPVAKELVKIPGGACRDAGSSGARLSQNAELVPWSISRVCLRNLGQKQESSRSVHSQAHLLTRTTAVSYCLPSTPLGCQQSPPRIKGNLPLTTHPVLGVGASVGSGRLPRTPLLGQGPSWEAFRHVVSDGSAHERGPFPAKHSVGRLLLQTQIHTQANI